MNDRHIALDVEARAGARRNVLQRPRLEAVDERVALLGGERERRLGRVGHARDRRRRLARGDVAHRGQRRRPSRGTGSRGSCARSGTRWTWTVASVMIPEPPLAAEHHLAHARPGRRRRHRAARRAAPPGVTTRSPRVRSAMSPYLSDCMPDERVAIQPPSVEWVKLSGKWPSVQPRALSCALEVGAEDAGLHARQARRRRRSRARGPGGRGRPRSPCGVSSSGASRLPEMFVPPPNGMTHRVGGQRRGQDGRDLGLVGRAAPRRRGAARASPRRWRTRSRRLLPRACTTRSNGVGRTRAPRRPRPRARPAARARAPRRARRASSKARGGSVTRPRSSPRWRSTNGPSAGLSSALNATPSSPHPPHFIAAIAHLPVAVAGRR